MRRIGMLCGLLLGLFCLTGMTVRAEDVLSDQLTSLLEEAGTGDLTEGLNPEDPSTLTGISLTEVLASLGTKLRETAEAPLQTFVLLCGVILLTAFAGSLQGDNGAAGSVSQTISVLCAVCIAVPPLCP